MTKLLALNPGLLILARFLERASYYGVRSVLLLYAFDKLDLDESIAYSYYSWFAYILAFGYLIGGILGSLVLKQKQSIIVGGVVQTLGMFILLIPHEHMWLTGGILISLGAGFYTPNLLSTLGNEILNSNKKLASGFTLLYFAVNLGAFIGVLALGVLGENFSYEWAILVAAILNGLAILTVSFTRIPDYPAKAKLMQPTYQSWIIISIITIATIFFWSAFEEANNSIFEYFYMKQDAGEVISFQLSNNVNSAVVILVTLILFFIWYIVRFSDLLKVGLGLLLAATSIYFLSVAIQADSFNGFTVVVLFTVLFTIAETLVGAIALAVVTTFSNPKYLALIIGVTFFVLAIGQRLVGLFRVYDPDRHLNVFILKIAAIILLFFSIVISLMRFFIKEEPPQLVVTDDKEEKLNTTDLLDDF